VCGGEQIIKGKIKDREEEMEKKGEDLGGQRKRGKTTSTSGSTLLLGNNWLLQNIYPFIDYLIGKFALIVSFLFPLIHFTCFLTYSICCDNCNSCPSF
jgi:hypothetical protein